MIEFVGYLKSMARVVLLACCVLPLAAHAVDQPIPMGPTSNWVVDYAEGSCVLRRTFGSGKDNAFLELHQVGPGDGYELRIGSDTLSRSRGTPRIRYGSDEDWVEPHAPFDFAAGDWHGLRFAGSLRPDVPESAGRATPPWPDAERDARETAVDRLTIAGTFEQDVTLEVGRMHAPLEAMRTCTRELVTHWGLDPTVQDTLSRRASPIRQVDWARRTIDAYPIAMIRQNKSARLPIRLIVGADGKPTSCVAGKGFADPAFETAACASSMRYARFEPALDAEGQPVASYFITTIVYQLGR
jgi:hypothetical protein